jgi:urocanate hydratase/imidazolonepropionase
MYGQMTAGSWIYIGTQGILQGTYETFAAVAEQALRRHARRHAHAHRRARRHGRRAAARGHHERRRRACVECDPSRIERRVETATSTRSPPTTSTTRSRVREAGEARERRALSVGVLGNAADVLPELLRRGAEVDIVTDQTSAHDPLSYLPIGASRSRTGTPSAQRRTRPSSPSARASRWPPRRGDGRLHGRRRRGLRLRQLDPRRGQLGGYAAPSTSPGFVPAYIRPLFCEGKGPFRWAALSGDPADIAATDRACSSCSPTTTTCSAGSAWPGAGRLPGPARADLLARLRRARPRRPAFNEMVASGEVSAPIVIGRDHLDCGSVASPYRETEAMLDGSDAIADWPLLNAMVNVASGASWVSIHHGGGVGMGRSIHAGQVTSPTAPTWRPQKLERVLTNDPGMGVIRHVDAGYDRAATRWPTSAACGSRCASATRAATDDDLLANARRLVDELHAQGVTTFETKSGYGLTVEHEARSLRIARELTEETTYLGAHVVPDEFADDVDGYVDLVVGDMLDACAPYARWVDVFVEDGAFDADRARAILAAGVAAGLEPRVHANQLGHGPGVQLGCEVGAASVDHCTFLSDADVDALAGSGTVATLLPGVDFSTRMPYPDARRLLDAGVTVALATDCNPGSSFTTSLPFCIALAVRDYGMTPVEAVWAATRGGAAALRRPDVGHLSSGARGDVVVLAGASHVDLAYRPGSPSWPGRGWRDGAGGRPSATARSSVGRPER